jgi:hypothetical protein
LTEVAERERFEGAAAELLTVIRAGLGSAFAVVYIPL